MKASLPDLPPIPQIPEAERTPFVEALHGICLLQSHHIAEQQKIIVAQQEQIQLLREEIQILKDEIARLKGHKPKPKIRPSNLAKQGSTRPTQGKRPGSTKRSKLSNLEIHKTVRCAPQNMPPGSKFKRLSRYTVQDIVIEPHNTQYLLEQWETPDGESLKGELPTEIKGHHFGPTLRSYIVYQYHHGGVTQPIIKEMLNEFGIDISTGQIDHILVEGSEAFHNEKDEVLRVGLEVSSYINVDDTGARHKGKNGYCTHIGNELFAWFASTPSKSRVNFLELLRGGSTDYLLSRAALTYMAEHKLPQIILPVLKAHEGDWFRDEASWLQFLDACGLKKSQHVRTATEGALLGSALSHGLDPELKIMSDDAGQFNILRHALCWVHAERTVHKLVGINDDQRIAIDAKRSEIWELYAALKGYKAAPKPAYKKVLDEYFDKVFTDMTCCSTLNHALKRIHKNKAELLLVLEHPDIPLHNNGSERDIREFVKRRKISGSTRSDLGRCCRDTFASLKKTCRKLGVSFWAYLHDRISGSYKIETLPELIRQKAAEV